MLRLLVDTPQPRLDRYLAELLLSFFEFNPEKLYSGIEFKERQKELSRIRHKAIEALGDSISPNIRHAFTKP